MTDPADIDAFADYTSHEVVVRPRTGSGGWGPGAGEAVTRPCTVTSTSATVIRDASGDEAVQSAVLFAALGEQHYYPAGSQVTLPSGQATTVLTVAVYDSPDPDLAEVNHIEVKLGQRRLGDGDAR